MNLSQAIIAGSRLHPQAFGVSRDEDGTTCAMQAAADAMGRSDLGECFPELALVPDPELLPEELRYHLRTLTLPFAPLTLKRAIQTLNDDCYWPRERIARWVKWLETK